MRRCFLALILLSAISATYCSAQKSPAPARAPKSSAGRAGAQIVPFDRTVDKLPPGFSGHSILASAAEAQ